MASSMTNETAVAKHLGPKLLGDRTCPTASRHYVAVTDALMILLFLLSIAIFAVDLLKAICVTKQVEATLFYCCAACIPPSPLLHVLITRMTLGV